MGTRKKTREELIALVPTLKWVHTIDLGNGLTTPGLWGLPQPALQRAVDATDFRGKKVLDIGCWDGLFSFEAEKRGASEVYATDLVDQRRFVEDDTFRVAHQILGSKARYVPDLSVLDVARLNVNDFDVVIFAGVFYHLKDPLSAFAALRGVMKEGATLIVEGAVVDSEESFAKFSYKDAYLGDHSNWWVPSIGCLREWVECSFFEIQEEFGKWDGGTPNLRYTLTAKAVRRADPYYIRPEANLLAFDRNTYPRQFPDPIRIAPDPEPAFAGTRRLLRHLPVSRLPEPVKTRLKRLAHTLQGRS